MAQISIPLGLNSMMNIRSKLFLVSKSKLAVRNTTYLALYFFCAFTFCGTFLVWVQVKRSKISLPLLFL